MRGNGVGCRPNIAVARLEAVEGRVILINADRAVSRHRWLSPRDQVQNPPFPIRCFGHFGCTIFSVCLKVWRVAHRQGSSTLLCLIQDDLVWLLGPHLSHSLRHPPSSRCVFLWVCIHPCVCVCLSSCVHVHMCAPGCMCMCVVAHCSVDSLFMVISGRGRVHTLSNTSVWNVAGVIHLRGYGRRGVWHGS
jgi:hypothetical protein